MPTRRKDRGKIVHGPTEYGKSVNGSPLEIFLPVEFSNPKLLVMAGIHGDEPESTVLLSEALRHLNPDELKNAVILCANPDGVMRGTRANVNGVDLNRNFPASNWKPETVYYRNNINEPQDIKLSPGSAPQSEPEAEALIRIISEVKPESIISIHGALNCIEDPDFTPLAKWIAQETKLPLVENVGYPTPGSLGSWASDNDIPLITFELPPKPLLEMRNTITPVMIKILTNNLLK